MDLYGISILALILLIVIAVIAVIVVAVLRTRRGPTRRNVDEGIGTVRRLYFYVVCFVALMMAFNGLVQILQFVLDGAFGGDVVSASRTRLAVGISLAVIGLPVWLYHWQLVQRHAAEMSVERYSLVRKLYTHVVLAASLAIGMAGLATILLWIFGDQAFPGYGWASVIVWGAVWSYHWRLESGEGRPTAETRGVHRLYLYLVSLVSLVMLLTGGGWIVHTLLLAGYEALVTLPVLVPTHAGLWSSEMKEALVIAIVGGLAWSSHWAYFARSDAASVLRRLYLHMFAMLGGLITVIVAVGVLVYTLLEWLIGAPDQESAAAHFRLVPAVVASIAAGLGVWGYHVTVARAEEARAPSDTPGIRRAYDYVLVAVGGGAVAVAVAVLVSTSLSILVDSARDLLAGSDFWRDQIALVLTLVLLGGPVWAYRWRSVQQRALSVGPEDRGSLQRRVFVFLVLAVASLALLGSASFLIFVFLRDLLNGELGLAVLRESKHALGIVAAGAILLPYHWMVYRSDREAEPEAEAGPPVVVKEVSVLVADDGEALVAGLESALGYGVEVLAWADPDAGAPAQSNADLANVAERVSEAEGSRVLLVPEEGAFRVLSYE